MKVTTFKNRFAIITKDGGLTRWHIFDQNPSIWNIVKAYFQVKWRIK